MMLSRELKNQIFRAVGLTDGPRFTAVIDSLNVNERDIQFDGFRLTIHLREFVINRRQFINSLEYKLSRLRGGITGRTFPLTIENDTIIINTAAISLQEIEDRRRRLFGERPRDYNLIFNDYYESAQQTRESDDRLERLTFAALLAHRPRYEARVSNHSADFIRFFEPAPQTSSMPTQSNNAKILSEIAGFNSENIPEKYCCPLSGEVMDDPVYDPAHPQYIFERAWIEKALERKTEHPYSRTLLSKNNLVSDLELKKEIKLFMKFVKGETFCGLKPGFLS